VRWVSALVYMVGSTVGGVVEYVSYNDMCVGGFTALHALFV